MTNYRDPRLTDPLLLALAGRRLLHRLSQPQFPSWQETEGLAALLDYARRCGLQDQPAPADDDLPTTGLGQLLREARAWAREHQPTKPVERRPQPVSLTPEQIAELSSLPSMQRLSRYRELQQQQDKG